MRNQNFDPVVLDNVLLACHMNLAGDLNILRGPRISNIETCDEFEQLLKIIQNPPTTGYRLVGAPEGTFRAKVKNLKKSNFQPRGVR